MFKIDSFYQTFLPKFIASDIQKITSLQKQSIDRLYILLSYIPSLTSAFSTTCQQFLPSKFLEHYFVKDYTPSQQNSKRSLIEEGRKQIMSTISSLNQFHQNLFQIFVLIWRQFYLCQQECSQQSQKVELNLQKIKTIYDISKLFAITNDKTQQMNDIFFAIFQQILSRQCHSSFLQFLNNFLQQCDFSPKIEFSLRQQIMKNQGNFKRKTKKIEDYDPTQTTKKSKSLTQEKKNITRDQLFSNALSKSHIKINTETPIKQLKSCKALDTTQEKSFSELDQNYQNQKYEKKNLQVQKWKIQQRLPLERTIHSKRRSKFVPKKVVYYENDVPSLSATFSQVFYDNGKRVSQRSYNERQLSEDEVSILVQATPKPKKKMKLQKTKTCSFDQNGKFVCH